MPPRLFSQLEEQFAALTQEADAKNFVLLGVIDHIRRRWLHQPRPPHTCGNPTAKLIPLTKKEIAENAVVQKILDDLESQYIELPGVFHPADLPF